MSSIQAIAAMKQCGNHTWREISDHTGVRKNTCKSRYTRKGRSMQPGPCPVCQSKENLGIKVQESGNTLKASSTSDRIRSEAELVAAIGLDLDKWVITDSGYRTWNMGAKIVHSDLAWDDDGQLRGWKKEGGLGIEQLFSVWITCVRRKPICLNPSIKQVVVNVSKLDTSPTWEPSEMSLVFGDLHVGYRRDIQTGVLDPFHDRKFMSAVIELAILIRPKEVHLIGDGMDLCGMTTFIASPEHMYTLQPTLRELAWYLARLKSILPKETKVFYHKGNHEARIDRELKRSMPELYGIKAVGVDIPALSVRSLLGLDDIGVEWVGDYPDSSRWIDGVLVSHGDIARAPGLTAKAYAENRLESTIHGHSHRTERATRILYGVGRKKITATVIGCGCRLDGIVPAKKGNLNWDQSVAIVHPGDVQVVSIDDGVLAYHGSVISCEDYVADLEEDIPDYRWR